LQQILGVLGRDLESGEDAPELRAELLAQRRQRIFERLPIARWGSGNRHHSAPRIAAKVRPDRRRSERARRVSNVV
jgi:hypothetical protein